MADETSIHRVQTRDRINVRLSTEEIRDRAMLLPKLLTDLDNAEREAKSVAKEHKKEIDRCDSAVRDMKRVVDSGEEFREVECERAFDVAKGITWLEYEGKKYLQRSATEKELELLRTSQTIFDEPPEAAADSSSDDDEKEDSADAF